MDGKINKNTYIGSALPGSAFPFSLNKNGYPNKYRRCSSGLFYFIKWSLNFVFIVLSF